MRKKRLWVSAKKAVGTGPQLCLRLLVALSYAQQASFDLKGALDEHRGSCEGRA